MSVYFIGYWSWHAIYSFLAIDIEHKLWQNSVLQKVCVIYVGFLYYDVMSMDFRIKLTIKYIKVFREWIMLIYKVTF